MFYRYSEAFDSSCSIKHYLLTWSRDIESRDMESRGTWSRDMRSWDTWSRDTWSRRDTWSTDTGSKDILSLFAERLKTELFSRSYP